MDMPGMDSSMPSGMDMPTATDSSGPLSTAGLDLSNSSVQADFLEQLLDDTEIQVTSNSYATYYWYGIVVVIGIAAILNLGMRIKTYSRLRAARTNKTTSNGRNPINSAVNLIRKIAYAQVSPTQHSRIFSVPNLGIIILLLTYLAFILALEFVKQDVPGEQHNIAIGVRAGWLTITQLPLLILLSGKINLIGLITGLSYERLNVLHRWVARGMLLTATFHLGFQQALWSKLGLSKLEWDTDTCTTTGIQAYVFLIWMNISTFAPIRNAWYELFVVQHILSFFAFIISLMLHLPDTALYTRVYVWIPIGLYILDRLVRSLRYTYNNIRPGRATLTKLPGGVTKVVVKTRQCKKWTPGSFVLLGLPRYGIGQSHPATIASTPTSNSGDLVFLLRAHDGFTKKIYAGAVETAIPNEMSNQETTLAFIDGPYGGSQLDFASFRTVVLVAGSTGVTFIFPILLDIASRAKESKVPVKKIVFVWAIKDISCQVWIAHELQQAEELLRSADIGFEALIFITQNENFIGDGSNSEKQAETGSPKSFPAASEKAEFQQLGSGEGNENISIEVPSSQPKIDALRLQSGRPDIQAILMKEQQNTEEEIGVAVCGPLGLNIAARSIVSNLEGRSGGIYLHVEGFGW